MGLLPLILPVANAISRPTKKDSNNLTGEERWNDYTPSCLTDRSGLQFREMHTHSVPPKTTLIFDGDDTLWRTMPLYTRAKVRFFSKMEQLGFDRNEVETTFERRDSKNVDRWGFTVERFRRSMVEVLEEFVLVRNEIPRPRLIEQISHIATSVSRNKTRRIPCVYTTLRLLQTRYRLVLLTKGEYSLQERRVSESGLADFFASVFIVERKDRASFERICADLSLDVNSTWSIGDSLRSDIRPALAAGLGAFWIPQETWIYENADDESHRRLVQLRSISELPRALRKVERFT
jgi:putative hydrolase of the HAD superfamily